MTTFNSISEIVNAVANFKSYTGEYIPNWGNTIEEDLIITEGNPFFALPEDDIQDFKDRYYYGDPNDTSNIYNNIQPGAYEDYDLSYLHK